MEMNGAAGDRIWSSQQACDNKFNGGRNDESMIAVTVVAIAGNEMPIQWIPVFNLPSPVFYFVLTRTRFLFAKPRPNSPPQKFIPVFNLPSPVSCFVLTITQFLHVKPGSNSPPQKFQKLAAP